MKRLTSVAPSNGSTTFATLLARKYQAGSVDHDRPSATRMP